MKVFIDSNAWVSAYGGSGLCTELVVFVHQRHEAVCHELILKEFARTLVKKFGAEPAHVEALVQEIREISAVHFKAPVPKHRTRDPKDDPILQAALDADSDWLVTGDADLSTLKRVQGMPITSPRDFLEALGVEEPWP